MTLYLNKDYDVHLSESKPPYITTSYGKEKHMVAP